MFWKIIKPARDNRKLTSVKVACEQAPVRDSRVQSRANGMNRERSGEEEVTL